MVMIVPVIGWKSKIKKMIQRYHLFMARSLQRPMHHYFCSPHMTCNMFDLISLSLVQIFEMKKPPPRLIDSLQYKNSHLAVLICSVLTLVHLIYDICDHVSSTLLSCHMHVGT